MSAWRSVPLTLALLAPISAFPGKAATVTAIGALAVYAVMAGEASGGGPFARSSWRACTCSARWWSAEPDLPNALAIAALLLLLADPSSTSSDPGFSSSPSRPSSRSFC